MLSGWSGCLLRCAPRGSLRLCAAPPRLEHTARIRPAAAAAVVAVWPRGLTAAARCLCPCDCGCSSAPPRCPRTPGPPAPAMGAVPWSTLVLAGGRKRSRAAMAPPAAAAAGPASPRRGLLPRPRHRDVPAGCGLQRRRLRLSLNPWGLATPQRPRPRPLPRQQRRQMRSLGRCRRPPAAPSALTRPL